MVVDNDSPGCSEPEEDPHRRFPLRRLKSIYKLLAAYLTLMLAVSTAAGILLAWQLVKLGFVGSSILLSLWFFTYFVGADLNTIDKIFTPFIEKLLRLIVSLTPQSKYKFEENIVSDSMEYLRDSLQKGNSQAFFQAALFIILQAVVDAIKANRDKNGRNKKGR